MLLAPAIDFLVAFFGQFCIIKEKAQNQMPQKKKKKLITGTEAFC